MALNHAFGVVQWASSATVGTTYTVNLPAGFDLKAIRFYHSGQSSSTDSVTQTVSAQVGLGFATGTAARRALVNFYDDANTDNATGAGVRNDCVAMTVQASGAPLGLLDVSSFSAEQFVLRVDDQNTTSLTVAWEAWGGSDITVAAVGDFGEPAATGVQSYTVTGFTAAGTDQVVMLAGNNITAALNTDQNAYGASIYCGYFTGSDSAQNVVAAISALEAANADTYRYCQTGECVATMTPTAGVVSGSAIGNFATDAFQLDWLSRSVTDRRSIFLAMKGGQWRAGAYTIDGTTLNATATVSGLPFQPLGVDLMGIALGQPAAGTSTSLGRLSVGSASSPTSRQSIGLFAQDGSANSEISLAIEYDQALVHVTFGAVLSAYDLSAINSDGFTVIVDDAGGPSTEWQGYLAFAGAAGGKAFPLRRMGASFQHMLVR